MKRITLTDKSMQKNLMKILTQLKAKGTVTISQLYDVTDAEAKKVEVPLISITKQAYDKMCDLVQSCSIEIAWHNTVTRSGNTFIITDTLCYPQIASPVTVESDDDLYPEWQEDLDDDTYNTLRMQGHSHVNMGVSPSSTDEKYYETMLKHVKSYYIFLIMNKRGDLYARIYDFTNNMIYEHKDIRIVAPDAAMTWAQDQMNMYVSESTVSNSPQSKYYDSPLYHNQY